MNTRYALCLTVLLVVSSLAACDVGDKNASQRVNGSVHIPAGRDAAPADTVNGSIDIDNNATVTQAHTVNGGVHLGSRGVADSLETVNGSISVSAGAHVSHAVESVNGSITLRDGAEVLGGLRNVNGQIEVTGAHVAGGIETTTGGIRLAGESRLEGGILVKKSDGTLSIAGDVPRIEIGPGAVVQGDLRFERPVKLFVSDRASIGPVSGATAIPFSGYTAPRG